MSFQRPLRATWVNCPRSCSPTLQFAACSETLIGDRVSNSAPPIKIRLSERGSLDAPSSGQARFGNRCARRAATRPKLILRRLLSMLKFGPVPPSGDRLQRGFQPASSLFSYEATQNRMQDPRIPKKVLTHNNVRPPYAKTALNSPCVAVICLFLTSGLRWSRRSSPASSLSFYCLLF